MKIRILIALSGLSAGFITPGFTQTTAKDLVGTWTLVSITLEQDGKTTDPYGANPKGILMRDADGHVAVIITKPELPKFAGNDRTAGTAEENKAIVQGSLAYFGTSTVNEADKTVTTHIESSTFPNWNGVDRKTSFNISGDEYITTNLTTTIGRGVAHAVWKRVGTPAPAASAQTNASPTSAQEKSTVDPEVRQQIEAVGMKLGEAMHDHDAAAAADLYTLDAIKVLDWTGGGTLSGRDAIEKDFASFFASSPPDVTGKFIQMYAIGDQIADISEWSTGQWRGYSSTIYVRDADSWKIRLEYLISTAAPR